MLNAAAAETNTKRMFVIGERANDARARALAFLVRLHAASFAATSIFRFLSNRSFLSLSMRAQSKAKRDVKFADQSAKLAV